jgi:hypothetical protein
MGCRYTFLRFFLVADPKRALSDVMHRYDNAFRIRAKAKYCNCCDQNAGATNVMFPLSQNEHTLYAAVTISQASSFVH